MQVFFLKAPKATGAKTMSLKEFYSNCECGECKPDIQLADGDSFKGIGMDEAFLKKVFKGELKDGEIHPDYYFNVAKKLTEAVQKGMGKTTNILSDKTRLYEKLKNNVFAFSAAKNLALVKKYNEQLTDENKEVRTFRAFRNAVIEVNQEFNDVHLNTEYKSAIGMAQMADKWDSLKVYKYLEYRTVGDNKVRDTHKKLDGLVLEASDPLWAKIYPPNDWNCRCTVVPAKRGAAVEPEKRTTAKAYSEKGLKPYFKRNVGTEQIVFNDDHPYFARSVHDIKKGNVHQFMAEENYAMPSIENILKQELPKLQRAATLEDAKKAWETADKHVTTADGLEWDMTNRWEHVVGDNNQDRWKHINNAHDVLANADEVWSYREQNPAGGYNFFKRYVKYYEGQPVVFSYDIDKPEAWTMYESDVDESGKFSKLRSNVRKGVLLHRK
jgi:SPP1 gp7 family putative phage head morphogenesis protein